MGLLKEFKEFAMKGNVIDLAVAVIIGGAFGKIVTSFVNDILMPPLGLLLGGVDFKDLKLIIKEGAEGVAAVTWNYGMFIQNIIDFLIIAFAIFMAIRSMTKMQQLRAKPAEPEPEPAPPEPSNEEKLLTEIRDLLKK
ncbi:MAG TPA: large-conductance mechanosensitive channel protein MscL [Bacteroidales bacterium]|nr:large-conductance mechanosensitive channel protein MscL [Bacteroidales bacterium]HPM92553.1 large-conductance mechanosensitive channel protein MscL [Bacteroidales bacterium]